ncbi:NUDIX domain-containing protein [Hyphomonas sp.]|uniref:NUDIX domain-containing protein n=1 Tax=Hyphomonas sp. TaxID=87 RepID=UPI0032D9585A
MPSLRTRLFHAYARLRRPMTLGVRGLVENADGQILLVRHTYISGWHMPGGGVERGEPCIESLRREVEEEGGILLNGTPSLVGMFSNHTSFPNDHVLLYHVPAQIWTQGKATAVAEIAETRWCAPGAVPEGTTQGTRLRLEEFYRNAPPTPYWSGNTR